MPLQSSAGPLIKTICWKCHQPIWEGEPRMFAADGTWNRYPIHPGCHVEKEPERVVPRFPDPPSPLEEFDAACTRVTQERGAIYGHPTDNFRRLAEMTTSINDCQDPILKQAIYMVLSKLARLIQNPEHLDSWIDVMGYARTAAMVIDKRFKET